MKDTKEENALLIPSIEIVAKAFESEESLEAIISAIEKECKAEHYTVATREGRDRIKSQAYKIARSKTAIDNVGKGLTEEATALIKKINGRRNLASSRLDALKDEIRAPLTEWEAADDKRKQDIKDRINASFGLRALPESSAALRALQDSTIAVELDDTWQEFLEEATKAKDNFLRHLAAKIHDAERAEQREREIAAEREAQRLELERLRAAEEERKKAEEERAAEQRLQDAIQAEKDAEIAKLRAELDAMKQQPMPAPVGIVGRNATIAVLDEVAADASSNEVEKNETPAFPDCGDNFVTIDAANMGDVRRSIASQILALIDDCETHEAAADAVAAAITQGKISYVQVAI